MRTRKTVVIAAVAVFATGCSAANGTGDPAPSELPAERPTYAAAVSEEEFCPEGEEIEALESTPENTQIAIHHNATNYIEGGSDPEPRQIDCPYFYVPSEEKAERITDDFATPEVELRILDEHVDPGSRSVPDPDDFPEFPDFFQVTGWDHTATQEETDVCLSDAGWLYEECEDGRTLVKEVFTLTGFDANLDVVIQVDYRYAGDPAGYGDDQVARIESQSRQIAAELLPLLLDRLPTADE